MEKDIEKLKKLLDDFGVEYEMDEYEDVDFLICREGMDGVGGYNWFFTRFEFDKNGNFIEMGAYE